MKSWESTGNRNCVLVYSNVLTFRKFLSKRPTLHFASLSHVLVPTDFTLGRVNNRRAFVCTVPIATTGRGRHFTFWHYGYGNSDFLKLVVALFLHLGLWSCGLLLLRFSHSMGCVTLNIFLKDIYNIVFAMFYSKISVTEQFPCMCLLSSLCPNPLLMESLHDTF